MEALISNNFQIQVKTEQLKEVWNKKVLNRHTEWRKVQIRKHQNNSFIAETSLADIA